MRTVKKLTKETAKVEAAPVKADSTAVKEEAVNAAAAQAVKATTVEKTAKKTMAEDTAVKAEAPAKKAAPARKTTAARKTASAKKNTEVKEEIVLQCFGKETKMSDIMAKVKDIWTTEYNKKPEEIAAVSIYLKPEEDAVYYVVNDEVKGSISL